MALGHGPTIVRDGLVLHLDAANPKSYPGTGTDWFDLSGNGNHGTLINNPTYSSDNKGTFVFDGANDYAEVPGDYHLFSELTIDFWFKPANNISSAANESGRPWGKGTHLESRFIEGTFHLDIGDDAGLSSATASWDNTTWYNVTSVLLTSSTEVYVQSELDGTGTIGPFTSQTETFQIGKSQAPAGSLFPGNISSFKIYNRALTAAEVAQNFNAMRGRYGL